MKVKEVQASYKRVLNLGNYDLGNYESITLQESRTAELEEGDDEETCMRQLHADCRVSIAGQVSMLESQFERIRERANNRDLTKE